MKNQVLSIEQMQELQELGIDTSKASMCWWKGNRNIKDILAIYNQEDDIAINIIQTFTLQDILKYLEKIKPTLTKGDGSIWFMEVHNLELDSLMHCEGCESESPLETAFKTIKWCKENGFV